MSGVCEREITHKRETRARVEPSYPLVQGFDARWAHPHLAHHNSASLDSRLEFWLEPGVFAQSEICRAAIRTECGRRNNLTFGILDPHAVDEVGA